MKEYIVTLKNHEDLDSFYEDMETPGGTLYIPDRCVEIANRRPISVNTHYYLTDEEAEQIRKDPRVLDCNLMPSALNLKVVPHWTQTSSFWDRSASTNANHKNWGLLRCIEGVQRSNWGENGTPTQTGTITANAEGRNVDVVIVDGFINPNHPEMALNNDGTGGTRVVQYNWLQHADTPGNYIYRSSGYNSDDDHGMHVAGTVAGNTQGWARSANIYNLFPYGGDPNGLDTLLLFDYIRAWHNSKPINPITGRRNPTIVNNSWGYSSQLDIASITRVYFRGAIYSSGLTSSTLYGTYGIYNTGGYAYSSAEYTPIEADITSAMNEGIIIVGSAGNDYSKIDIPGGIDYNNYYIWNGYIVYYHRGSSPGKTTGSLCIGSIGRPLNDSKSSFSNCGPRIDVYAPGSSIISSVHNGAVGDPRNGSYRLSKFSGTSMASPQVCGVLACLLEIYPDLTQTEIVNYIHKNSKYNQIFSGTGNFADPTNTQGSVNRYLYYYRERPDLGTTWPKLNYKTRPNSGRVYPRQRRRAK